MKQILTLLLLLCSMTAMAQDVIEKKNGTRVECKIVQVTNDEIVFKQWTDLKGPNYIMNRSDARAIYYQDGSVLQGRQYQDSELLAMTKNTIDYNKRARNYKWTEYAGIGVASFGLVWLIGAGIVGAVGSEGYDGDNTVISCSIMAAGGFTAITGWVGNRYCNYKMASQVSASPIYQQDFTFKNGTRFSASTDLIQNNLTKQPTIGLGFHYNF